ncbi:MAG TPA: response regulator [Bryobacteraceae bacterium]|nr:response regulator [Bryobacteraceae bacterium]
MAYRILIVDDSPAMRTFVRRVVALTGLDVSRCLEASDGREGLEVLQREWVDVILTDINMPGMDGEEFLRRLAGHETFCSIPAIVISTDATRQRIDRLLALGACRYITKPFLPETLRAELEAALEVPCA